MGLLRRLAGILGFPRDDAHDANEAVVEEAEAAQRRRTGRGFSVQVPVAADRPALGPVLVPCSVGDGGVQGWSIISSSMYIRLLSWMLVKGLRWYSRRLRVDEDGDVADEFLDEIHPIEASMSVDHQQPARPPPVFQFRYTTVRPVVRKQIIAADGNLHHNIEHQGKLLWV